MGVFKLAAGICLGLLAFVAVVGVLNLLALKAAEEQLRQGSVPRFGAHLATDQVCVSGTVVRRARQSNGTLMAVQLLEFGRPVACSGEFRLADQQGH